MSTEINIDALVGPTHHFGGLGVGNIASQTHALRMSRPRSAALEGLRKAALVASLDIPQFVLPPPMRPRLDLLEQLGLVTRAAPAWRFTGRRHSDWDLSNRHEVQRVAEQLQAALVVAPRQFSAAFSSAFMWAANAATVTAAIDTHDGRTHFTPANLISSEHRAGEAEERSHDLQRLFADPQQFVIHAPLPRSLALRDEGAANHMRLWAASGQPGFNIFVYGADASQEHSGGSFFPRQTLAASQALCRLHGLHPETTFLLQQHPQAVAAGVFHNDVIATSHRNVLIHHQQAFWEAEGELELLERLFVQRTNEELIRIEVSQHDLSLQDAVASYFFNSQIVTPGPAYGGGDGPRMVLISPAQCRDMAAPRQLIDRLLSDERVPIDEVRYVSLEESMANGGGPACLRLRVPLETAQVESLAASPWRLDAALEERLAAAIEQYYPLEMNLERLCQPDQLAALWRVPQQLNLQS